ncbi:MAG: DUF11 domain-containing protein [Ardenticatenaceae bacterium]|nr:DUF11 domain-containing protein [Ardenticatenaceae bacterium]
MFKNRQKRASFLIVASFFLANLLLLLLLQRLQAEPNQPANLSGSQKLVNQPTAHPGDTIQYSIVISNSSPATITATLNDPLPAGLMVATGSLTATQATTLTENSQNIAWSGLVAGHEVVTVSFAAVISSGLAVGEAVVNTAVLTGTGQPINLSVTTELVSFQLYLPFISRAYTTPVLQPIQLTCASDDWTVNWNNTDTGVMYELQEAHNAAFTNPTTYNTAATSQPIANAPSTDNFYYYRVRSTNGTTHSPWSNSVSIIGSYLDNFSATDSGWFVGENSNGRFRYDNNGYEIASKKAGFLLPSLAPDVERNGYIAATDVRWRTGSPANGIYGLVFGANEDVTKYYFLAVYAETQEYWLFFFDSSQPTADRLRPIFPSRLTSAAINPGHANNHLQVTRIGSTIEVAINGVDLGSWSDNAQTGATRAGLLITANPSGPESAALFDNFKVSACGSTSSTITPAFRHTTAVPQPIPTDTLFLPAP